ncbi:hypothetical protein AGMMS50293_29200 [Spirochaetia bacterium]|nr:hypothetical protein AGMMS50293_29200 [Spirochaetia bacterium]
MLRKLLLIAVFPLFAANFTLAAQDHEQGNYADVIRGEVWIELEPIYGGYVDQKYPLDALSASRRALEEAALFYSAMIYGWSFHYDIGERARHTPENFELVPVASIPFGDPGLRATDVEVREMRVRLWTDYHLTPAQQRRMQIWRTGNIRNAQAVGYGPLGGPAEFSDWLTIKKIAMEDAARAAVRAMLRGSERNRPKEVLGFISLASFPNYYMDSGRWAASARFRVQVTEIIPFAAY